MVIPMIGLCANMLYLPSQKDGVTWTIGGLKPTMLIHASCNKGFNLWGVLKPSDKNNADYVVVKDQYDNDTYLVCKDSKGNKGQVIIKISGSNLPRKDKL